MKDPAFLFYPNDYLGGTMGMTFEQKGAYIELLMTQFNRGHMTSHMIGHVLGQNGGQIWDVIKSKFKTDDQGMFYNERLEIEQNKRKAYTITRLNNISGKNQYSKENKSSRENNGHMGGHMTNHMENENINIIIDKDLIKEKGVKGKKQEEKKYADFVSMTENNYQTLVEKYGSDMTVKLIEILDNYKASTGKRYKDDYRAILSWVIDTYNEKHAKKKSGLNVRTPLFK